MYLFVYIYLTELAERVKYGNYVSVSTDGRGSLTTWPSFMMETSMTQGACESCAALSLLDPCCCTSFECACMHVHSMRACVCSYVPSLALVCVCVCVRLCVCVCAFLRARFLVCTRVCAHVGRPSVTKALRRAVCPSPSSPASSEIRSLDVRGLDFRGLRKPLQVGCCTTSLSFQNENDKTGLQKL